MPVLVACASKHGSTLEIAERIAATLRTAGLEAEARPLREARDLAGYDAFVVGSALYMFHWMKEAGGFTPPTPAALTDRPVWLFSSGPLGADELNAEGRDPREVAGPKEIDELMDAVKARDHRVFFGAFRLGKPIGLTERTVMILPAARAAFPEGDFRDWREIEAWAEAIARELSPAV